MRYLGGKTKLVKHLSKAILSNTENRARYIEPFVGGGSVLTALASHFETVHASDMHPDLILMWQGLQDGSFIPPTYVTEDEYNALKHAPPSALRGFVGFGCSFGAKWFGGYARDRTERNYAAESARGLAKKLPALAAVSFKHLAYQETDVRAGDVVYCDPPYESTTGYSTGAFDHGAFWQQCRDWTALGATVFISEYAAPDDFAIAWTRERTRDMRDSKDHGVTVTECLYTHQH